MSFVWNGVSSDTMKFNVTSRQVYNAPAYDLNAIEVPGRSGDLLNPQNRFKNKQISYTGFLKATDFSGSTWREKLSTGLIQLKGWLCSDAGQYNELTDDYDPGFTRYGYISGETAISDIEDRPFGVTLTVTFNVKPFMYKAGEPMELPETKSASGSIITITDGAENTPLKSAVVNIEPVQSGSGDPSPTNIRPISGWSEVNVVAANRNLTNPAAFSGMTEADGIYTGSSASMHNAVFATFPQGVGRLRISFDYKGATSVRSGYIRAEYHDGTTEYPRALVSAEWIHYSFQTSATKEIKTVAFTNSNTMQIEIKNFQIVTDATEPTYESPHTTPITIPLGQTVYGGTLDVVRGKLVVDRAMVDLGSLTWEVQGTPNTYQSAISAMLTPSNDIICSMYPAVNATTTAANMPDKTIKTYELSTGKYIIVKDSAYATTTAFKTAMNGVQLVYPLATPIEVDLTPQTIKTLLGTNNIWADAGAMSIEYPIPTENPYPFGSRPLYEITMAGTGTLVVNGKEWTITDYTGTLYCDTEAMEWYDASQLRNNIVSGDGWPVFEAGENSISYTGDITKVMVTPRWRTL